MPAKSRQQAAPPSLSPAPATSESGEEGFGAWGNGFAQDQLRTGALDPGGRRNPEVGSAASGPPGGIPYRTEMETAFGEDFGGVRAHFGAGPQLAALEANAAALGDTVVFADENPDRDVVAHELTHVVQARRAGRTGSSPAASSTVSSPAAPAEQEAEAVSGAVARGEPVQVTEAPGPGIHRDFPDAGVPLPAGLPPTDLEEAQRLARNDDAGVVRAFDALMPEDQRTFGQSESDLGAVCRHAPWRAREILLAARPTVPIWLRLGGTHVTDDETRVQVLRDCGVDNVDGFLRHVDVLNGIAAFAAPNVLRPAVTGAADGAGSLRLLRNGTAVGILRSAFQSESCVEALPNVLSAPSADVLAAYTGDDRVGAWFTNATRALGTAIVGWGSDEAARWIRALAWKEHGRDQLVQAIEADRAGWGGVLVGFLNPPTDADAHWLRGIGPANALGDAAIRAVVTTDLLAAARICGWASWAMGRFLIEVTRAGGTIDRPAVDAFLAAMPARDANYEFACVTDPVVCAFLMPLGHPITMFPLLISDPARLAATYGTITNILFAVWLDTDLVRLDGLITGLGNHADWVRAFQSNFRMHRLVWLAAQAGSGATWKGAVDGVAGAYDAVVANPLVDCTDPLQFRGLAALFGDGTGRTGAQAEATFRKLCPTIAVDPPGEHTEPWFWQYGLQGQATPPGAAAPVTYRWALKSHMVAVQPQPDTWLELVRMIAPLGATQVAATRRLIFADHANKYWMCQQYQDAAGTWQTGSQTWRPYSTPGALVTTSVAWADSATILQRTVVRDAGGNNIAPGGSLAGARTDPTPQAGETTGWGDESNAGVTAGIGRGVGTDDTTRVRNPDGTTTTTPLSFFQNHARHEFGHQVGARSYQASGGGTLERGDDMATRVGGWSAVARGDLLSRLFTTRSGARLRFTDGNLRVTAAQVREWLGGILADGAEPTAGDGAAITNGSTDGVADKLTAIGRAYGGQKLHGYVSSLANLWQVSGIPNMAFEFGGYTPAVGSNVLVWSTRNPMANSGASYSKPFFDRMKEKVGWYAFSSSSEMFAEMYTRRYTVGAVGDRQADRWFDQLEQSPGVVPGSFTPTPFYTAPDATMTGLMALPNAAAGSAPPAAEVEPPANLIGAGYFNVP